MPMSITKGEGVTIITLTSNPKSDVPLVFQLLATLCYSPACCLSQGLKRLLGGVHSSLGAVQIMMGLFTIGVGAVIIETHFNFLKWINAPYWLGAIFIFAGIMCILAKRFSSPCLVCLNVFINIWSAALAITAIVLFSVDMGQGFNMWYYCRRDDSYNSYGYRYWTTLPPEVVSMREREKQRMYDMCLEKKAQLMMLLTGLDIVLIVFGVIQLCVAVSVCVLSIKALCKYYKEKEDVELQKGLLEEVPTNPVV